MKTKDVLFGIFALLLVGALAYVWLSPSGLKQAPAVTMRSLDGTELNTTALRGKPLLVTFWATSCTGCVKEIPHLIDLYKEFSPEGFQIIAVAMDYDPPNHVIAMQKGRQIPYPIVLDIDGSTAKAFGDVRLTPTSFLIAADGRIVKQRIGELDMTDLRNQVRALLGA